MACLLVLVIAMSTAYFSSKLINMDSFSRPGFANTAFGIWWLLGEHVASWLVILLAVAYGFMHLPWWQAGLLLLGVIVLVAPMVNVFVVRPLGAAFGILVLPLLTIGSAIWLIRRW